MNLFGFFRRRPAERRDAVGLGIDMGTLPGSTSQIGLRNFAENLSAIVGCINAVSGSLAMMPARIYRQDTNCRVEVHDHPLCRLIRNGPCPRLTWPDFLEMLLGGALLAGNAIAIVDHDASGQVVGLRPIPWQLCQCVLLPDGTLVYDVTEAAAPWGGNGVRRRFLEGELLHLKDRSDDGYIGRSRLSRAPSVLEAAMGIQTFSTAVWENGAFPSGFLTHPGKLNREGKEYLADSFAKRYAGAANSRRTAVLDEGMSWVANAVSPEDAEVLASRRFSVEELCRLYNVPPPIVQDYSHASLTNAVQAGTNFAVLSLTPWARKIEAEFSRTVFGEDSDHSLEIDLSGLLRGDYATMMTTHIAAVTGGILTRDEAREAAGFGPAAASTS